jgi:DNA ligase-1
MINLIKSLENEPSTNKKIELLKNFKDKTLLKEVLFYTLNPEFNYFIKKLPKMKTYKADDFVEDWVDFRRWLDCLNKRLVTGNEAITKTIELLELMTPEIQELCKRILFRDLRCNVSDSIVNKVFPKLIPEFKVQLANKYNPDKKYKNQLWAASRKMDGLRCVFKNGKLYTRNGKEVVGFDHIVKELTPLGDYDLIVGELYSPDIPFQEIQGYVMRNKNVVEEDKRKIFYNIFAMLKPKLTTAEMVENIEALSLTREFVKGKMKTPWEYLRFVDYEIIDNDFDKIKELDSKYVAEGYEGVMLRSMDVVYDWKRSDALVKYKSFKEEDLLIVDAVEGTGKYKGMLGAFVCEGKVEGHKVKTECGSGFNDEQRVEFWKNRKEMIGLKAEIKFQGLTDDKSSLRFPIFKGTKEDR